MGLRMGRGTELLTVQITEMVMNMVEMIRIIIMNMIEMIKIEVITPMRPRYRAPYGANNRHDQNGHHEHD